MSSSATETNNPQTSIFESPRNKEALMDNWRYGSNKTMRALFIIGAIFLIGDLLVLSTASSLNESTIAYALVVPLMYAGLGFLAKSKPFAGVVLAAILFVLVIGFSVYAVGAKATVSGFLIKTLIIYFIINGFKHARDAEDAKKKLSHYQ